MNIVYISNAILPSKTANSVHVMKMCSALVQNGHKVTLLAPDRYKEYESNVEDVFDFYNVQQNFTIKYVKYSYIKYIGIVYYSLNTLKIVKSIDPDIVYGRNLYACFLTSFFKNTIYEIHAPMNNKIKRLILDKMQKNKFYKKTIVISRVLKDIILKTQVIKDKNIIVAHDAADEPYNFDDIVDIHSNTQLNIGYVGSLYKGKGIEVILEIAVRLPFVTFHIVGGKKSDILYWKNKINLDNVMFHGFVTQQNIYKYMNFFDIVLLPNQKNVYIENKKDMNIGEFTSPLKLFEYMASKKAIIASNLEVLREVLNEKNAILVEPTDFNAWINAINRLENEELRKKISQQAYLDFTHKYSWNQRVYNILREVFS